jgi:hypothetical protein
MVDECDALDLHAFEGGITGDQDQEIETDKWCISDGQEGAG